MIIDQLTLIWILWSKITYYFSIEIESFTGPDTLLIYSLFTIVRLNLKWENYK